MKSNSSGGGELLGLANQPNQFFEDGSPTKMNQPNEFNNFQKTTTKPDAKQFKKDRKWVMNLGFHINYLKAKNNILLDPCKTQYEKSNQGGVG